MPRFFKKPVGLAATLLLAGALSFAAEKSKPKFRLAFPGQNPPIDYTLYGSFENVGTEKYRYKIKDAKGLAAVVGEGIYPNSEDFRKDPAFGRLMKKGRLKASHWVRINTDDLQEDFFIWAKAAEDPGVKQFYISLILERAGLLEQAVKSYYAVIVHYPGHVGWTHWKTPWYVGPTAIDRIQAITRNHPELGLRLVDARIKIINGHNDTPSDDKTIASPGRLIKVQNFVEKPRPLNKPVKVLTRGSTELRRYPEGDWEFLLEGKPYLIRGMAYDVTPVGKSPDNGSWVVHRDWMLSDINRNGRIDGPYDAWVDKNRNNKQDPKEGPVGDFKLLQEMGVNTLRLYHHGYNKELLQDLHKRFGIRVIMGDYLGAYAIGSGAGWYEGTDYTNPSHKAKMLESVKAMVEEYKDEPYILFWMLGNENNYGVVGDAKSPGTGSHAKAQPEAYYAFLNEAAEYIHQLDPSRFVSHSNGDLLYLDYFAKESPAVDIFGCNAYRGSHGFGSSLWLEVKDYCDKPVIITEYGCPAYIKGKPRKYAEAQQSDYLKGSWEDILTNRAGYGAGNAIGGSLFHWLDGWWKAGPPPEFNPAAQDIVSQWAGPFPGGQMYEEWLGVTGQGNGKHSPFLRQLRPAYFMLKELWNEKK